MIIDDHPEVTVVEDSQSNLNDDGFTEVVSKKQQKRLQDEERRKKEEQTVQVRDTSVMQKTFLWYWECCEVCRIFIPRNYVFSSLKDN